MEDNRIATTVLLQQYHCFDGDFWAGYKALEKLMEPDRFAEIKTGLLRSKKILPMYIADVGKEEYEKALEEINKEWKDKNDEAKAAGLATHEALEKMFTKDVAALQNTFGIAKLPVCQIDNFMVTESGLFPEFKMEVNVGDYILVGVADLVVKQGKHISIIDWKDVDKISFKGRFDTGRMKTKNMRYPLNTLPDVNGTHYNLQLSIYAWCLQQLDPDLIIDKLEIVHVRDMKPKAVYPVEYLKNTVEKLIRFHINDLKLKKDLEQCNPIML